MLAMVNGADLDADLDAEFDVEVEDDRDRSGVARDVRTVVE